MENKSSQTVKDLRSLAKQRGLTGYTRLTKAELSQLIDGGLHNPRKPAKEGTVDWLRAKVKSLGYKNYGKLSKEQLTKLVDEGRAPARMSDRTKAELIHLAYAQATREQLLTVIRKKLSKFPTKRLLAISVSYTHLTLPTKA